MTAQACIAVTSGEFGRHLTSLLTKWEPSDQAKLVIWKVTTCYHCQVTFTSRETLLWRWQPRHHPEADPEQHQACLQHKQIGPSMNITPVNDLREKTSYFLGPPLMLEYFQAQWFCLNLALKCCNMTRLDFKQRYIEFLFPLGSLFDPHKLNSSTLQDV